MARNLLESVSSYLNAEETRSKIKEMVNDICDKMEDESKERYRQTVNDLLTYHSEETKGKFIEILGEESFSCLIGEENFNEKNIEMVGSLYITLYITALLISSMAIVAGKK